MWRNVLPNGDAVLLDPATGSAIDPNVPHQWIVEDPRLAEGFGYLQRHAGNISVKLVFGRHQQAGDLGDPRQGWFEQQVQASDAYAFEAAGWNRQKYFETLGRFALSGEVPQLRTTFSLRRWLAAARSGTPSFSYDIENTDRPLDVMANKMLGLWLETLLDTSAIGPDEQDWKYISNCLREWYMVGKLGYELGRLSLQEQVGPVDVLMTVGAAHRDLVRKIRGLGVTVRPITARFKGVYADAIQDNRDDARVNSTGLLPGRLRSGFQIFDDRGPETPVAPATPTVTEKRPQRPPGSSIGEVARVLSEVTGLLPQENIFTAMAMIDARITQLQSETTEANQAEMSARIDALTQARFHLLQAYDAMGGTRRTMGEMLRDWGVDFG